MSTEPDQIRAHITAVLGELPGELPGGLPGDAELAELPAQAHLDEVARRLEEAHDLLVRALESAEKG